MEAWGKRQGSPDLYKAPPPHRLWVAAWLRVPPPEGSGVVLLSVNLSWPEDTAASRHAERVLAGVSLE